MNIMSMLVRLQGALGRTDLIEQMVLLPQNNLAVSPSNQEISLVVGYNSSPKSQTALDLTLWIAHQTRLATRQQVTVQVVYVLSPQEDTPSGFYQASTPAAIAQAFSQETPAQAPAGHYGQMLATKTKARKSSEFTTRAAQQAAYSINLPTSAQNDLFEQADHILWQARCLADEWRGSLKTHLRFGQVAQELRNVVQKETASLLLIGCNSRDNAVVQGLGADFPCPVLGIPAALHWE